MEIISAQVVGVFPELEIYGLCFLGDFSMKKKVFFISVLREASTINFKIWILIMSAQTFLIIS